MNRASRIAPYLAHSIPPWAAPRPWGRAVNPSRFRAARPASALARPLKILLLLPPLLLLAFLLLPAPEALAWGPGVHMVTGNWLLQNLYALPAPLAAAIMQHPGLFLQGSLAPDIFIGKGSVAVQGHSHNWATGLDILHKARTRRKLAYACGYLAHLAADTVAHNVFVPEFFPSSLGRGRFGHVYLEALADNTLDWDKRDALSVFREEGSPGAERMLRQVTGRGGGAFWLKKQLFRHSIALGGGRTWRVALKRLDRLLHGPRPQAVLDHLLTVSTRAMVSLLADPDHSLVRGLDPVGTHALAGASDSKFLPLLLPWEAEALTGKRSFSLALPGILEDLPRVCLPGAMLNSPAVTVFPLNISSNPRTP